MLSVRGLSKAFGAKRVLDGVDLDLATGESLVVIGGSGTGKSVLLRCILGLEMPDRGEILWRGAALAGQRAAFMYSLIVTARMNDVYPQAWLADVLARLPDIPLSRLPELLPWNWSQIPQRRAA